MVYVWNSVLCFQFRNMKAVIVDLMCFSVNILNIKPSSPRPAQCQVRDDAPNIGP